MSAVIAYIGLGSNQEDPARQLQSAFAGLSRLRESRLLRHSGIYRSAPWGVAEQPDFLNAVAELETRLSARELLDGLLDIERQAGRRREGPRWGPRSIDLDLLVYAGCHIDEDGLAIPHPRMAERAFVLLPLAELAPSLEVPGIGVVARLLEGIDATACTRLD
ncbi:MAG: 2-amino-4-hydroxy-6-hydroxymethyldihydropteridine diphosphokinase [Xanthomonadales bacterium]|nr:2-amino-4-hydroxy-6-hydroxymethyldihydropteridine diphosphokinase [Xanthomonadales bacterium]